jgi:hypothetical protein
MVFRGAAMVAATFAIGGVLLLVMIVFSWYGAVTLPRTARIPVHWGFGYNRFLSKRAGLILWPAGGALIYGIVGVLGGNAWWSHGNSGGWEPAFFMTAIMGTLVAFQAGALAASRRSGP